MKSKGKLAYSLKALLSQFLQELHSCQLSSGILQREAVLPSRQCSLLDGAGWNAAPGLPVCMDSSRERASAELGHQPGIPLSSKMAQHCENDVLGGGA